jgi:photosystem II stability/assembly factor-like uncharacterized protein
MKSCRKKIPVLVPVFFIGMVSSAIAQQGWAKLTVIRQGDKPAVVNAVTYDGDDIWVVGAQGLIAHSPDNGSTFYSVPSGTHVGLNDVVVRGDRIWMAGDQGNILRSTDGGRSFSRTNYALRYREDLQNGGILDLYSIQFIDKDTGYIVGDRGLILTTRNGGESWREQYSGTDAQLFHLSIQGKRGWVVGTGGKILHTDDGGRNWYPQRSGVPDDLNRVYFVDDKVGLITGDHGVLLRSANSGATWERVSLDGVQEGLFGVSFSDKRTGWIVGYGGRIIRTADGGLHWVDQESATHVDLFAVSFYKGRGYAIGRDGLVMRYYEKR